MENASKALLMAGGVLIGVLVISLAVYLFADFGATSARINAQNTQKQITAFNSKFTVYQGYEDDITIYDIISLATFVNENNAYYGDSPEEIVLSIGNKIIVNTHTTPENAKKEQEYYNNLIKDYVNTDGSLNTFRCEDGAIGYNDSGRVNRITFIES